MILLKKSISLFFNLKLFKLYKLSSCFLSMSLKKIYSSLNQINRNQFLMKGLFVLSILLVVSCSEKEVSPSISEHSVASELMERGLYTEAIIILEKGLSRDPLNEKSQIMLAASYAGRAGVFISDFIDFANDLKRFGTEERQVNRVDGISLVSMKDKIINPEHKKIIEFLNSLHRTIGFFNRFLSLFDLVPVVANESALVDLEKAISVLDKNKSLSLGGSLYRGLLRVSLLKYEVKLDRFLDIFNEVDNCKINSTIVRRDLNYLKNQIKFILYDFSGGENSEKKNVEIEKLMSEFEKRFEDPLKLIYLINGKNPYIDINKLKKQYGTDICVD